MAFENSLTDDLVNHKGSVSLMMGLLEAFQCQNFNLARAIHTPLKYEASNIELHLHEIIEIPIWF